jgi:hypothetical protein
VLQAGRGRRLVGLGVVELHETGDRARPCPRWSDRRGHR